VTPDAVIYRYLQIIARPDCDVAVLSALLSADADLLTRWLKLLDIPADASVLQARLTQLDSGEFQNLAQAQAWSVLPTVGSARLGIDQWMSVLRAGCLAEVLAEHFEPSRDGEKPARNVRLRALLGVSGVHLPRDRRLAELVEFRGTNPALLEDAGLELRIFAVVDGLEIGREIELAERLLDLSSEAFAALMNDADNAANALVEYVGIDTREETDWAQRIWMRQQINMVTAGFGDCDTYADLSRLHDLASRCLFARPPLLLVQTEAGGPMRLLGGADISVRDDSRTSLLASCVKNGHGMTLSDAPDSAVVDRQLLRELECDEAYVVPLSLSDPSAVMLAAADEDTDVEVAAELYAEELGTYVTAIGRERHEETDAQSTPIEEFRARETKRLREIVHEANNPLSIVHNYLHILELRLQHEPEAVEQLEMIASELRRAGEVIAQARDVPSLLQTEASLPSEAAEIDVGDWASRLAELHLGYAAEHGVPLNTSIPARPVSVVADRDKLTQIATNLLKSAVEACEPGDEVLLGVRGGVYRDGSVGVEIYVEDTGPGLSDDVLHNLTVAKRTTKEGDHQGLGLQLAFKLTIELDGALDVRTEPGEGTTFSLFLPAQTGRD